MLCAACKDMSVDYVYVVGAVVGAVLCLNDLFMYIHIYVVK